MDASHPAWVEFNSRGGAGNRLAVEGRRLHLRCRGLAHKAIADAVPQARTVEFAVGYEGCFARYKVFKSQAWAHAIYGQGGAAKANGQQDDAVIHGYLDPAAFPAVSRPDDYFLFVGRLIDRKGYKVAIDACSLIFCQFTNTSSSPFTSTSPNT